MPNESEKLEAGIANLIKLRDKLLNLRANSSKIKLSLRKDYTWDLWELEDLSLSNNIPFSSNFIPKLFEREKFEEVIFDFSSLTKFLKNTEEGIKIKEKNACLKRNVQRIYSEKGINNLYLGFLFLRGYFSDSQGKLSLVNAPLFFFPCNFQKNSLETVIISKNKKINYSLLYFLKKVLKLENDAFTKCLKNLEKNDKKLKIFLSETHQNLEELLQKHVSVKFSSFINKKKKVLTENIPIRNKYNLEAFASLTLSNKPKEFKKNELELSFNAVLSIEREDNLSLFNDFNQIITGYSTNDLKNHSPSGLDFFTNKNREELTIKGSLLGNNLAEKLLFFPFDSDPSQSHVLKTIFNNFFGSALYINGPPGTGKTQLICNLISNCLVYNKKVAVVCEKNVALEVIRDKLTKIGISQSTIKINDLGETSSIYRDILNVEETFKKESLLNQTYEKDAVALEKKKKFYLTKLFNYHKVQEYFHSRHNILLGEVYIRRNEKINISPELIHLTRWVENKEQLNELLKEKLADYIEKLKKVFQTQKELCLNLKHLFLSPDLNLDFNTINQNYLNGGIDSLLLELKGEKNHGLISQIVRINLVKEKSKNLSAIHLLKKKNIELISLCKRQDLRILLIFLNVKTFDEFWKKFSNQAFLLNLQEFVNNNFFTIGNLFSLINNSDENIQKNIKFLLKKVFLSHEIYYLDNYLEITEQAVYLNWINSIEEKHKLILHDWNFQELFKIHEKQKKINKNKKESAQEYLKTKQKTNHRNLVNDNALNQLISKKRNIPRLRKIFPFLINYFPIWLTVPEVMSSIVELDLKSKPVFDFLIFDESSQITLESAIPLLHRAKKFLVIGDDKQLPPTDILKPHLEDDEEEEMQEEEEEIIYKEVKDINLQGDDLRKNNSLLNWTKKYAPNQQKESLSYHYRSEYPELIEFSNQTFYKGNLQIIRDNKSRENFSPIEYHKVEGKWKNNTNQEEVRYIFEELLEKKLFHEECGIGIITFNEKQRELMEREYRKIIEKLETKNNLFIKNLEKVQGDEREIIIFSISYGPDEDGKIAHRFGPLNREGGENRLNVAISRAKKKMIIVSSILPTELNVSNSKNLGPKLLKKFLEYAHYHQQDAQEKIQEILEKEIPEIVNTYVSPKDTKKVNEFDSLFEKEVFEELVNLGYKVKTQIGSFGYKIDLAVINNKNNQYALGIECDGWTYHHRREEVERDNYRQTILEKKGWTIIRICSRDWWGKNNKKRTVAWIKEKIDKKLELL